MSPHPRSVRRPARLLVAAALLSLVTAACSGSGDEVSPDEALGAAKERLDETSGVTLSLAAEELPAGVNGVLEATGTGTRAPAFAGDLKVRLNSLTVDVPVVSVDGVVYAKLPFTSAFSEINPADYEAPDPAGLTAPDGGVSSWLTAATGVEQGEQTRDDDLVLTSYSGTLPGASVAAVIPSADADAEFPVTFLLDDDRQLRKVEVSGPFYGDDVVDYTVSFDAYDVDEEITRP